MIDTVFSVLAFQRAACQLLLCSTTDLPRRCASTAGGHRCTGIDLPRKNAKGAKVLTAKSTNHTKGSLSVFSFSEFRFLSSSLNPQLPHSALRTLHFNVSASPRLSTLNFQPSTNSHPSTFSRLRPVSGAQSRQQLWQREIVSNCPSAPSWTLKPMNANLRQSRDLLLPRLLSGQVNLAEN